MEHRVIERDGDKWVQVKVNGEWSDQATVEEIKALGLEDEFADVIAQ